MTLDAFQTANPAERVEIIRNVTNSQAAALYNQHRSSSRWVVQPPREVSGLKNAVLFLMVKDEADIIGQNLEHHYALGFRRFFILDNASVDDTALVIHNFRKNHPDAGVFYAYDYVVGYYQALKMNALDLFMQSYLHYEDNQPDWLFIVDADEFITCASQDVDHSIQQFNSILEDKSKNLLIFHWVQCSSQEVIQSLPGEYDIFSSFPLSWPRMKVEVSKIAYRLGKGLSPIQGNHAVEAFPYDFESVAVMAELGFYFFHFPNRTVEQFRKKLVNGNKAVKATKDRDGLENTAGHWRTYYQWYLQHGDVAIERILGDHIRGCIEA